jgi:hypothetical protein
MNTHDVTFEERIATRDERLRAAQATLLGCARLLERAREGEGSTSDSNVSCAVSWLTSVTADLRAVLAEVKD